MISICYIYIWEVLVSLAIWTYYINFCWQYYKVKVDIEQNWEFIQENYDSYIQFVYAK